MELYETQTIKFGANLLTASSRHAAQRGAPILFPTTSLYGHAPQPKTSAGTPALASKTTWTAGREPQFTGQFLDAWSRTFPICHEPIGPSGQGPDRRCGVLNLRLCEYSMRSYSSLQPPTLMAC